MDFLVCLFFFWKESNLVKPLCGYVCIYAVLTFEPVDTFSRSLIWTLTYAIEDHLSLLSFLHYPYTP
jgi:hypothetical protein